MTNTPDNNAKLREESQILTEVIKSQLAEMQRLRAINARLMAAPRSGGLGGAKRKYTRIPKPRVLHS